MNFIEEIFKKLKQKLSRGNQAGDTRDYRVAAIESEKTFSAGLSSNEASKKIDFLEGSSNMSPIGKNMGRFEETGFSNRSVNQGKYQPDISLFLDTCKEATKVLANTSLSNEVKSYYSQVFNQITSQKKIDLENPKTLKAYLSLKKLVKYKDKISLDTTPGRFDEKSPFVGEYATFHRQLTKENLPAWSTFSDAIYKPEVTFYMIPQKDRQKADLLGDKMLQDELKKYGTTPERTFSKPTDDWRNVTTCCDIDNEWNNWNLQISLDTGLSKETGEKYAPLGVIALHELGHVRQYMPGGSKQEFESRRTKTFAEIAPTIDLIVRQDEIYKKIHNIPLEQEVKYPKSVTIAGKSHSIGQIANHFRQIKEKYGFDNFEQVLLTNEAKNYVVSLCNGDSISMAAMARNYARRE